MDKKHSDKGNSISIPKKNSKTETAKNETKNLIESPAKIEKGTIEEIKKPIVMAPSNNVNIEKNKVLANETNKIPNPQQNIIKKFEPGKLQKKAPENKLSEIKRIIVNHFYNLGNSSKYSEVMNNLEKLLNGGSNDKVNSKNYFIVNNFSGKKSFKMRK